MLENIVLFLDIILIIIILGTLLLRLYLLYLGTENVVVTPSGSFTLVSKNENSMTIKTSVLFKNIGKSGATIMDAICRPQLPYEQYDKIAVRGKAEQLGRPREDDYFEAVIVHKKGEAPDEITINPIIELTARKGLTLDDALKSMVDINVELIWLETGRNPVNYKKIILRLTADEIKQLANVK